MTLVGAPATPHPTPNISNLVFGRRSIAGSLIGGIAETQEMLDFCAKHGITAHIEEIAMQDIRACHQLRFLAANSSNLCKFEIEFVK